MELFGIDIASIIGNVTAGQLLPLTVHTSTSGTRTDVTAGTNPSSSDYIGEGIIEDYTTEEKQLVDENDRKVLIIANSLVPSLDIIETGDEVTIESRRYRIIEANRDPAGATWTCRVN